MSNVGFTPGWNDPPPCAPFASNPPSTGAGRLNRQRRPVDPSIQCPAVGVPSSPPHGNIVAPQWETSGQQSTHNINHNYSYNSQLPQQQHQHSTVFMPGQQQILAYQQQQISTAFGQVKSAVQYQPQPPLLGTHPASEFSPAGGIGTNTVTPTSAVTQNQSQVYDNHGAFYTYMQNQ